MRFMLKSLVPAVVLLMALPLCASTHHHHKSTRHAMVKHVSTPAIAPERASEIQQALIKQGYLTGVPSGTWDAASVAAMQKMQSDNGWQTKYTPDARALIKLGLEGGDETADAGSVSTLPNGAAQ